MNLAVVLLFCFNVLRIFTKNAEVSKNFLLTKCNFICIFIWCKIKWRSYIKHWKSKLILINCCLGRLFAFVSKNIWALHKNTKNCWKLCNLAFKLGYILICVIHETKVIHAITSSSFLLIFTKTLLMSAQFWRAIGNFCKFSEFTCDCEVTYQILRLYYLLLKYK